MKVLSEEAVRRFDETGYHFPIRVMDAAEAADYRTRLQAMAAANPTDRPVESWLRSKAHLASMALYELVHRPTILDAVEDVLGPDILCWASGVFWKKARDPGFVSWHQDAMYWGLTPPDVVTAWVALTDSHAANGAMQVARGSHRALLPHTDTFAADNMLSRGQEIRVGVDPAQAVTLELSAGEMSLHHVNIAHGSPANTSDQPRIGFAIRYVAPHVRQAADGTDSALLVRGVDRYRHFRTDKRPRRDYDPDCLAWQMSARTAGGAAPPGG